jgi:hypothetical protein
MENNGCERRLCLERRFVKIKAGDYCPLEREKLMEKKESP